MQEFFKSLSEWFEEKTSSPFWYTLLFVFIAWNWQIIYTLFFENINDITKIQYICRYFFEIDEPFCPLYKWNSSQIGKIYGVPLGIAVISIWIVPWWSNVVFRARLYFDRVRETDIDTSNTKLGIERKDKVASYLREEEQKQQEKKMWQEIEWLEDYEIFRNKNPKIKMSQLELQNKKSTSHYVFLENDLIRYQKNGKIEVTKKGFYFLNKYLFN